MAPATDHLIIIKDDETIVYRFSFNDWLEASEGCNHRLVNYCTLTSGHCEYAQCPGNNMTLSTDP